VAATIVVAALFAGLFVALSGGGSDEPALRAGGQVRLTFPTTTTADGAEVTRVWSLQGDRGREFVGTLTFDNPTSAPLVTSYIETIPKALAASVDDITFDPQPEVLQADPVVQYSVVIPADQTFTARYEIAVAPDGVRRERLETWADELDVPTTTTTTAPPVATTTPTTTPTAPPVPPPPPATQPNRVPDTAPAPTEPPEPPPTTPPVETATIVIQVVSGGGTGTFDFSGSAGSASLTTAGSPNGYASWSVTVPPGTYTMTQTGASADWYLNSVWCSAGSTGARPTGTYVVAAGETAVCTFENVPR
jgi:hypothetical protein